MFTDEVETMINSRQITEWLQRNKIHVKVPYLEVWRTMGIDEQCNLPAISRKGR